jgi:hypothetical protein
MNLFTGNHRYDLSELQSLMALRAHLSVSECGETLRATEVEEKCFSVFLADVDLFLKRDSSRAHTGFWNHIEYSPDHFSKQSLITTMKGQPITGGTLVRHARNAKTELRKMAAFWVSPQDVTGERLEDRLLEVRKKYNALPVKARTRKQQSGKGKGVASEFEDGSESQEEGAAGEEEQGDEEVQEEEEEAQAEEELEEQDEEQEGQRRDRQPSAHGDERGEDSVQHSLPKFWLSFLLLGPPAKYISSELETARFLLDSLGNYGKRDSRSGRAALREREVAEKKVQRLAAVSAASLSSERQLEFEIMSRQMDMQEKQAGKCICSLPLFFIQFFSHSSSFRLEHVDVFTGFI